MLSTHLSANAAQADALKAAASKAASARAAEATLVLATGGTGSLSSAAVFSATKLAATKGASTSSLCISRKSARVSQVSNRRHPTTRQFWQKSQSLAISKMMRTRLMMMT